MSQVHGTPDMGRSSDDFPPLTTREQALIGAWMAEVERLHAKVAVLEQASIEAQEDVTAHKEEVERLREALTEIADLNHEPESRRIAVAALNAS